MSSSPVQFRKHTEDVHPEPTFLCIKKSTWDTITKVGLVLSVLGGFALIVHGAATASQHPLNWLEVPGGGFLFIGMYAIRMRFFSPGLDKAVKALDAERQPIISSTDLLKSN